MLAENRRVVVCTGSKYDKTMQLLCYFVSTNKQNTKQAYRKDKCKDCRKDNRDTQNSIKKRNNGLRSLHESS